MEFVYEGGNGFPFFIPALPTRAGMDLKGGDTIGLVTFLSGAYKYLVGHILVGHIYYWGTCISGAYIYIYILVGNIYKWGIYIG